MASSLADDSFRISGVEVAIGLLVIFSVGLTIYEVIVDNAGAIEKIEGLKQRVRLIEFINGNGDQDLCC